MTQMRFDSLNWVAIASCVIVGQAFLTIWFVALFGQPWAEAYGVADKKQHAKEIPAYTYAIGAACVLLLSIGLAALQTSLGVDTAGAGLMLGFFVALHFCIATGMPGYAFLERWSAFFMAIGSQAALIMILSVILAVWRG